MRTTPVVMNLIFINVIVFFIQFLVAEHHPEYSYLFVLHKNNWLGLRSVVGPDEFTPLQLLTHFFSHGGLLHIFFNMFALSSLGSAVEAVIGPQRFLKFYLFSGFVGGIFISTFDPSPVPVLGASGAVSGVLLAYAMYFPKQRLMIFPLPFSFQARSLVLVYMIFTVAMVTLFPYGGGGISHFGHLAGMIAAFLYFYLNYVYYKLKR